MADTQASTQNFSEAVQEISDWLINQTLLGSTPDKLLKGVCEQLNTAGIAINRGHIACGYLHPLFRSFGVTWTRDGGIFRDRFSHNETGTARWKASPLKHVLDNRLTELRRRIGSGDGVEEFDILQCFADEGSTDYVLMMTPFSGTDLERAAQTMDGCQASFCSDAPDGFSDVELEVLRRLFPRLGVGLKTTVREQTTQNIVSAYLGSHAGDRVLHGQIRLGDGDLIPAVIWYSDMRGSTALADKLPPHVFLRRLNRYFHCTAGAVLDHGGEVLRFIGDAVLAIFPIAGPGGAERAARMAVSAAREAMSRCETINADPKAWEEDGEEARLGSPIGFGLGLHVGELLYGNIGVPDRVEFSVIGAAANEAARLEGLTKSLDRTVIASDAFMSLVNEDGEALGSHRLRGVSEPQPVYAIR